jgi:hypothetical protein
MILARNPVGNSCFVSALVFHCAERWVANLYYAAKQHSVEANNVVRPQDYAKVTVRHCADHLILKPIQKLP